MVATAVTVAATCAAEPSGADALDVENPPAELSRLVTLEGASAALAEVVRTHQATVFVWWATSCPQVREYEPRMAALRAAYDESDVAVVAIASNGSDVPALIRKVAAERELGIPIAIDPGGKLAALLGVRTTPTTVVLDRKGRVRFRGWIDNQRAPGERGRVAYVERAVNALLGTGSGDADRSSPTYGCRITRGWGSIERCAADRGGASASGSSQKPSKPAKSDCDTKKPR